MLNTDIPAGAPYVIPISGVNLTIQPFAMAIDVNNTLPAIKAIFDAKLVDIGRYGLATEMLSW